MNFISSLISEIIRVQAMIFIAHASSLNPPTPRELSRHLKLASENCEDVLAELVDDGLIDPLPQLRLVNEEPLRLTPIGAGWLHWMRNHAPPESLAGAAGEDLAETGSSETPLIRKEPPSA